MEENKPALPKYTYTITEAAEALNVGPSTLRHAIADGRINVIRFGRAIRITAEEIEKAAKEGW